MIGLKEKFFNKLRKIRIYKFKDIKNTKYKHSTQKVFCVNVIIHLIWSDWSGTKVILLSFNSIFFITVNVITKLMGWFCKMMFVNMVGAA